MIQRSDQASFEFTAPSPMNGATHTPELRPPHDVEVDIARHVATEPPPLAPVAGRRSSANLRRHVVRAALRITALAVADLAAFAGLRAMLRVAREVRVAGIDVAGLVSNQLPKGYLGGSVHFAAALVVALVVTGNYAAGDKRRDPWRLCLACMLATALPLWTPLWSEPALVIGQFALTTALLTGVLVAARFLLDRVVRRLSPAEAAARALLVGPGAACIEMLGRTTFSEQNGFHIVGFVDTNTPACGPATAAIRDLERVLQAHDADTIIFCGQASEETFARIVRAAMVAECELLAVSRTFEIAGLHPAVVWRRGQPFVALRAVALRGQQLVLKRLLDIALSGIGLVVLAPVILMIAAAVRIDSRGPVFFGQSRVGRHGRRFKCYKFRSMHVNAEQMLRDDPALYAEYVRNDYKLPPESDTRITRMGRFLRRTSLDELPQLWNVLRGDMSLVGPRPIVPDELRHYGTEEPLFLSLKPGVTGAWQVRGRSNVAYPARAWMEIEYVQSWTLGKDIGILARTIPAVLAQRGAH